MQTPEFLRVENPTITPIPVRYERTGYSWAAVTAGVAIATALTVLFAEVGLALNLGIIDRSSDAGTVTVVNGVLWVVTGLIALFAGTWVAGYVANTRSATGGGLHGVGVWAASSVLALALAFTAAGTVAGGMLNVVGSTVAGVGKSVVDGLGGALEAAAPDWESIRAQLAEATDQVAGSEAGDAAAQETRFLDESRLMELAGKNFSLEDGRLGEQERAEFVELIAARLDISPQSAERTLTQWDQVWTAGVERYEAAKAEAVQIAEQTADVVAVASAWAAIGMLLGLIVSALGGAHGTVCRVRSLQDEYLLQTHKASMAPGATTSAYAAQNRAEEERVASTGRAYVATHSAQSDSMRP